MKLIIPLLLLFNLSLSAQQYFYSNSLAMELDEISLIESVVMSETEWILKKTAEGNRVESVLFNFGEEKRKYLKDTDHYSEYVDGVLSEEINYRRDGQISKIVNYNTRGLVSDISLYEYNIKGELIAISLSDESGEILSKLEYATRDDGSLRIISRYTEDDVNHRESWNGYNGSIFMEERTGLSSRELVFYNELNNIEKVQQYVDDILTFEKQYSYYPDGVEKEIKKESYISGEITIESMNVSGQIIRSEVFDKDVFLYSIKYFYSGSQLIQKEKTGLDLSEKWIFHYSDDELIGEDFYKQRTLVQKKKITDSENNAYIIELYDSGKHFMNLIYSNDQKVREEFLSGGEIVRTRELGE